MHRLQLVLEPALLRLPRKRPNMNRLGVELPPIADIRERWLSSQKPSHAGKYRPQPPNHGHPGRRQIKPLSQSLTELLHCEVRKASASDKRSRRRRNSRYRSVMLTAVGFFEAFF